MNSATAVVVSQSALMHISLAYLSEELQAIDSVIESIPVISKKALSRKAPLLPVELLLLIRSYVLLNATDHLIARSCSALKRYETALRHLLCPECITYYEHVYGDDLWQWQQFSGACACSSRRRITQRPYNWDHRRDYPVLNPKRFINRTHWLEFYLSLKSLRLLHGGSLSDSIISTRSSPVIWDLVSAVLGEFGCQTIRHEERRDVSWSILCHENWEQDTVLIVPSESSRCEDTSDQSWMAQVALKRVERDLGLSAHYAVNDSRTSSLASPRIPNHRSTSASFRSPSSESYFVFASFDNYVVPSVPMHVVNSLYTVFLTALSLPLSILTLALTIACYYSKPGAFRLL